MWQAARLMSERFHECALEVRGHELDGYGHVNHAIYVSYLEHARWKMLDEAGIDDAKMKGWGSWPVIAEVQLRYLKPCFRGDALRIETRLGETSRTSFWAEHAVYRGSDRVLEGKVRIVWVNSEGRAASMHDELKTWLSGWGKVRHP